MNNIKEDITILPTDENLISLIKNGDKTGISFLYDKYAPYLFMLIYKIVQKKDLTEDLLQETFIKIWLNIETYNPDKSKFSTWISNIARNLSIDTLRSRNFKNQMKNLNDDSFVNIIDEEISISPNTDHIGVVEILNKVLTDDHKRIIDTIYFKGFTQSEAAELLNIPLGTLKTKLRAAIKILREHLK